jgi:hypothetical protein
MVDGPVPASSTSRRNTSRTVCESGVQLRAVRHCQREGFNAQQGIIRRGTARGVGHQRGCDTQKALAHGEAGCTVSDGRDGVSLFHSRIRAHQRDLHQAQSRLRVAKAVLLQMLAHFLLRSGVVDSAQQVAQGALLLLHHAVARLTVENPQEDVAHLCTDAVIRFAEIFGFLEAHAPRQQFQLSGVGRQSLRLLFIEYLQPMLDGAQETVAFPQDDGFLRGEEPFPTQTLQSLQRVARAHRGMLTTDQQLQQLHGKLDIADTPFPDFHVGMRFVGIL